MTFPPNVGPKAPERNPQINPQFYKPSNFVISAITTGPTTTVTTSTDNDYVIGQQVRFTIPFNHGISQINGQQGLVIDIPASDQVVVNINSTNYNAFIANPTPAFTPAQIAAIGDVNTGAINDNGPFDITTYIAGSFLDISPN